MNASKPGTLGSYHTQLSNLILDFVIPQLSEGESKCLLYILRHTIGFQAAGGSGRREWDQISLSQFENGSSTGGRVLDDGTGLSRPSIVRALDSLQEKGLVQSTWVCPNCYWKGDAKKCPLCQRQCDRAFNVIRPSAKSLVQFLNQYDRKKRVWSFDRDVMRFSAQTQEQLDEVTELAQAEKEYVAELWYPEIVADLVKQMESAKEGRKLTSTQKINHFYIPILEMQKTAQAHPHSLKHALTETLRRRIPAQDRERNDQRGHVTRNMNVRWWAYPRAIISKELAKPAFTQSAQSPSKAPPQLEDWANDLLKRARNLNRDQETDAARSLLSELLGHVEELATLLECDAKEADATIRYAYKIGEADLLSARQVQIPVYDFYPEWSWPKELEK